MSGPGRGSLPLATLRRISTTRPQVVPGERCEMCAEPIAEEHQHVVGLESRSLMCTCRGVLPALHRPGRHPALPGGAGPLLLLPRLHPRRRRVGRPADPGRAWPSCFRNSVQDRVVAFYPSPAGATESELPLDAWDRIVEANPQLGLLLPDVEALLIHRSDREHGDFSLHAGADRRLLRAGRHDAHRRGAASTAAQEARAAMDAFFAMVPSPAAGPATRPWPRESSHERASSSRSSTSSPSRTPPRRSSRRACASRRAPASRSTRSRCAARSGSSRSDAATPTRTPTGLRGLFGERERWSDTLRPFLWMQCSTTVQGFTGITEVDLAAAVHLRLRGDRLALPARPRCGRRAAGPSCSRAPSSPGARTASASSRCPGTARPATSCRSPCGSR